MDPTPDTVKHVNVLGTFALVPERGGCAYSFICPFGEITTGWFINRMSMPSRRRRDVARNATAPTQPTHGSRTSPASRQYIAGSKIRVWQLLHLQLRRKGCGSLSPSLFRVLSASAVHHAGDWVGRSSAT